MNSKQKENYGSIKTDTLPVDDADTSSSSRRGLLFPALAAFVALTLILLVTSMDSIDPSTISLLPVGGHFKKKPYSNTPRFFDQQVDHLDESNTATWPNRYYAKKKYFKGPGHPIFLEIGGEGGNDVGMFYGFVDKVLAKQFGAYVLHPEHRFFGISQPLGDQNATTEQLLQLLTPEQAMLDMLAIAQYYRKKLGCSMKKSSNKYCPLITVGGSYPGFVAAMCRLLYPEVVDMAYASSAPLKLYSKQADQYGYYEVVTDAAERASPGCSMAVKSALNEVDGIIRNTTDFADLAYQKLRVCPGSIPAYINNSDLFSEELLQIIESTFADADMLLLLR